MNSWLKIIVVTIVISFIAIQALHAQPGDPGGDPDVPLGGIEWLLAAGAALGAKKWLDRNKKR